MEGINDVEALVSEEPTELLKPALNRVEFGAKGGQGYEDDVVGTFWLRCARWST